MSSKKSLEESKKQLHRGLISLKKNQTRLINRLTEADAPEGLLLGVVRDYGVFIERLSRYNIRINEQMEDLYGEDLPF